MVEFWTSRSCPDTPGRLQPLAAAPADSGCRPRTPLASPAASAETALRQKNCRGLAGLACVHGEGLSQFVLLANAKLADDLAIPLRVALLQIIKQTAALAHQHQKSAARPMVLLVQLKVLRQLANALAQEGNLDLRTPGVRLVRTKLLDNVCLLYGFQHSSCCSWSSVFFALVVSP